MTKAQHTPGPLTIHLCEPDPLENVYDLCGNQFYKLKTDDNDTVAIVFYKKDAELYSASPTLLSVAKEALECIKGRTFKAEIEEQLIDKLQSAINAAAPEGE